MGARVFVHSRYKRRLDGHCDCLAITEWEPKTLCLFGATALMHINIVRGEGHAPTLPLPKLLFF